MKTFCQITVLISETLIAATLFDCSLTVTKTVTLLNEKLISASSAVLVTSALYISNTANTNIFSDYMTISLINVYETQLSLFFKSNADVLSSVNNSTVTALLNALST